jgi:hypothetical protein
MGAEKMKIFGERVVIALLMVILMLALVLTPSVLAARGMDGSMDKPWSDNRGGDGWWSISYRWRDPWVDGGICPYSHCVRMGYSPKYCKLICGHVF